MKHVLSPLPFAQDAFEPTLSAETIRTHYEKHHQGYVDTLNTLIDQTEFQDSSLIEIIQKSEGALFNAAAQVWNHDFYWQSLSTQPLLPTPELQNAISRQYLSLEGLKAVIKKVGLAQFGSGWIWMTLDAHGELAIESTSNADLPIKHGKTALWTLDIWEHAYYIDYRNRRAVYLDQMVERIHWDHASQLFTASTGSTR